MRKISLLAVSIACLLGASSVMAYEVHTNQCNNFEFSIHNTQNHAIKGTYELPADGALKGKPTKGTFTVAAKQTKKITTVINGYDHKNTWVTIEIYDKGNSIFKGSIEKKLASWTDKEVPAAGNQPDYYYIQPAGDITLNSENLSAVKEEKNDAGYCGKEQDLEYSNTREAMMKKIKMGSYTLKI